MVCSEEQEYARLSLYYLLPIVCVFMTVYTMLKNGDVLVFGFILYVFISRAVFVDLGWGSGTTDLALSFFSPVVRSSRQITAR